MTRRAMLPAALLAWILAAALALSPGGSAATSQPPAEGAVTEERSFAVYPPQRMPIRFDHRRHVEGLAMSCVFCHETARQSRRAADRLLPSPTVCDRCHESDHDDENAVTGAQCDRCHEGYRAGDGNRVARVLLPTPNLHFDHAAHAARDIGCRQCHEGVGERALATRSDLPPMERCLDCHGLSRGAAGDAKGDCLVCHLSDDGRRMTTKFDTGSMLPPPWLHGADHGPGWIERHRNVAAADSELCATCHEPRECVLCHDGQVRPRRIHPSDWLTLHPTAARQQSTTCTSCHRQQSFCLECHQRVGVSRVGAGSTSAERGRFHPPASTWTDPPKSPGHHAWEAQRNLDTCVSCHTERDCATCHATRASGGVMPTGAGRASPHPRGFAATCGTSFRRNARPCLVCHLPGDPQLAQCR